MPRKNDSAAVAQDIKRLFKWYTAMEALPEPAIVGNIADLHVKAKLIRAVIDSLREARLTNARRDTVKRELYYLLALVKDMGWIVRDIYPQLEWLCGHPKPAPRVTRRIDRRKQPRR